MTYLPEAEIIRKSLEKEIVGKRFKDVTVKSASTVGHHRNRPEFAQLLQGRKIQAVTRAGTQLLLELDDGATLVLALGSDGTVHRETATAEASPQTQAVLTFTTGGSLHVIDAHKESRLLVAGPGELDGQGTGIDPLAGTFTWQAFGQHLVARSQPLAQLLRDETFILGLGDVYADEILWSAGLAGERLSSSLSSQEIRRLYRAVFEVLYEAIKHGGVGEDSDGAGSENARWKAGHLNVHGRQGQPCLRCRRPITSETIGGDVTVHHCASCQT